jgi:hypothetical protein
MRLPNKLELGRLPITFCAAYNSERRFQMKTAIESAPMCFIDLETPQPEFQVQDALELHLGVSGLFKSVKLYSNTIRSHIDIYIPIEAILVFLLDRAEEIVSFYSACKKLEIKKADMVFLARKKLEEVISREVP